jgi:hypothetical protein
MSDDNAWQPIATVPLMEPVELAEFPHVEHEPKISVGMSREEIKLAFPRATHWRRPTADTYRLA